jgi:uncharacterized protein (DUF2147 family)
MKFSMRSIVLVLCVLFAALIQAALPTPEGRWTTIDDKSGKPKSTIKLSVSNGTLNGSIQKIYKENVAYPDETQCVKCTGALQNQPLIGLMIVRGLKQNADGSWSGGQITDPESGKTYKCTITPSADGKTLSVRGYIGVSLLGRSQTWVKAN